MVTQNQHQTHKTKPGKGRVAASLERTTRGVMASGIQTRVWARFWGSRGGGVPSLSWGGRSWFGLVLGSSVGVAAVSPAVLGQGMPENLASNPELSQGSRAREVSKAVELAPLIGGGDPVLPSIRSIAQAPSQYLTETDLNASPDEVSDDLLPPLPQRGLFRPITLAPGFTPDPFYLSGISGGRLSAEAQAGRSETETGIYWGYVSEQPDHRLVLTTFFDYLNVGVASAGDTTLVIRGPGGTWCSDDASGQDPRIGGQWLPGTYEVWVGSADPDTYLVYDLQLTEVE
ncbi:MAG: hypothetical protein VKJ85_10305 [Prochlorothrix sp.]|nr:hypothetical protein [Prochlorothrix sp.]